LNECSNSQLLGSSCRESPYAKFRSILLTFCAPWFKTNRDASGQQLIKTFIDCRIVIFFS